MKTCYIYFAVSFYSFNLAHSFLENVDDVDIISDAEVNIFVFVSFFSYFSKNTFVYFLEHQEIIENAIQVKDYFFCKVKVTGFL